MKLWIKYGLLWGAVMFVILCLFFPWYENKEITFTNIVSGIALFCISGLMWGYFMFSKITNSKYNDN